jgi:hypothetical protein
MDHLQDIGKLARDRMKIRFDRLADYTGYHRGIVVRL